jgi:AcrR family transcriptional regulator
VVNAGSSRSTGGIQTASARRVYRSALRARQAQQTREDIVEAAEQLFAARGYAATSLAEIAQLAEVSIESVAAHGPKRSLLLAALDLALGGQPAVADASEHLDLAATCRRPLPADVLAGLADLLLARHARSAGMWRALVAAATGDPELAAVQQEVSRRRCEVSLTAVRLLAERGLLREDRSVEELADTATLLAGPEAYHLLVRELGWSEGHHRAWYVDSMRRLLLR